MKISTAKNEDAAKYLAKDAVMDELPDTHTLGDAVEGQPGISVISIPGNVLLQPLEMSSISTAQHALLHKIPQLLRLTNGLTQAGILTVRCWGHVQQLQ